MSWPAIDGLRKWTNKRTRLLQGLLGLAVDGVASFVPGGALAVWSTRIIGEFAKHGIERLSDATTDIPNVKPAGQAIPAEQLDQLNGWLASLSSSYKGLLDRLEDMVTIRDDEPQDQLQTLLRQTLTQNADLAREFKKHEEETQKQTLSLARIEVRLDDICHGQKNLALAMEELKALLIQCATRLGEWDQLRQVRPADARVLVEVQEHFQAGRLEQAVSKMEPLLAAQGVGQETLLRQLAGSCLAAGDLKQASRVLQKVTGPDGRPPAALTKTLTSLTSATTRGHSLPVWRSLPRGFVIDGRWRIDSEIGRGGMASVYRAVGIDHINKDEIAAIKVPAPGLLDDAASLQRLITEIKTSQKLSRKPHAAIVETMGYVHLADPHTGRALYGLVLEYIDGQTLANWLAQRQASGQQLSLKEIFTILDAMCAALEHAHGQTPPILHRDLKPANIMVTLHEHYKLMDFGIARVLEDRMQSLTGSVLGTWVYLPPEFLDPHYQPDVRSDVFLAATLLVELLTFHPHAQAERRTDCPKEWLKLIGSAKNPVMSERPASIRAFREQLRAGFSTKPAAVQVKPVEKPASQTPTVQERKLAAQKRAIELAKQHKIEEAFKLLDELPLELQDIAFSGKFKLQMRESVHKAARQLSEKEHKHGKAASLLQMLPETLRDAALLQQFCTKRDDLDRLDKEIRQRVQAGRFPGLRPKLRRLLELEPTNSGMRDLFDSLEEEREIVNSIGMKLVLVEPGVFLMGSPPNEAERIDNEHQHEVEITQPFYAGIYQVTQEQYQRVMDQTPSHFSSTGGGKDKVKNMDTRQFPVENVTWDNADDFCRRLSEMPEEKENERLYRLPTEAEWEYICRGGPFFKNPSPPFYFGNSLSPSQANFDGNYPYGGAAKGTYLQRTTKVGSYPKSPLGLYDLHGNVWEWCADWYDADYYKNSPRKDPQGPANGERRVLRGGSWNVVGRGCRSACRIYVAPGDRGNLGGFRVLCVVGARTL